MTFASHPPRLRILVGIRLSPRFAICNSGARAAGWIGPIALRSLRSEMRFWHDAESEREGFFRRRRNFFPEQENRPSSFPLGAARVVDGTRRTAARCRESPDPGGLPVQPRLARRRVRPGG